MTEAKFSPGFRFLPHDKWVLLAFLLLSPLFYQTGGNILLIYASVVIVQFFLFCNVFRIPNQLEFCWLLAVLPVFLVARKMGLNPMLEVTILFAWGATVIAIGMRKPLYCGIFWEKINPALKENWEKERVRTKRELTVTK
jgi:hypothetical protein